MIYAIHAEGTEFVKIGIARGPGGRLKSLQTGCPFKLVVLAHADWPDAYEARIHRFLGEYHVRGEWFRQCDALACIIEDMQRGGDWRMRGRLSMPKRLRHILTDGALVQSGNSPKVDVLGEHSAQLIEASRKVFNEHYVKSLHIKRLGEVSAQDAVSPPVAPIAPQ